MQKVVRVAGRGLAAALAIGAGVGALGWAALAGWRWATTTPRLAVEAVCFEGLAHATEAELLRLGGLAPGQNLLLAELAQAEQAMRLHPWIRSVSIARDWPRTIRVAAVEHRPAALLALGGLYLVNPDGVPFKRALPGDDLDLPVITGLDRGHFGAGEEGRALVREALSLYAAWSETGLEARWPASEVRVDDELGLTLVAADGAELSMGAGEFPAKVGRLARVREGLALRGQRASKVDLANRSRPGWVAVELWQ